jgi:predicted SprT family Zn-dependent metalloprotease
VTALEQNLEPLPYHLEVRDYLKSRERELWNWFASAQAKANYTDNLRLELLKSTYRLDPEGHADLYASLQEAQVKLQLEMPVTLYQAQNSSQLNASLFFMPEEGHIVFSGPVVNLLSREELKSVIGHELTHYHLWRREGGEFHIADRLLQAVSIDPRAAASHEQTARRYQLYTEIFADRGSLCVTGVVDPVVASLVKVQTGLAQVSAPGYLKQAEEIFSKANVATEGLSHPEAFIRARALALWQEQGQSAAPEIKKMIEGAVTLEDLDLSGQEAMTRNTRRLLEYLLQPEWIQTPAMLGHARLFFHDFKPVSTRDSSALVGLASGDSKLNEYFCYLLLDFATADPDLEDLPLTTALDISRQLELEEQFEKLVTRELKMKLRDVRRLREQAAERLAKAEARDE